MFPFIALQKIYAAKILNVRPLDTVNRLFDAFQIACTIYEPNIRAIITFKR